MYHMRGNRLPLGESIEGAGDAGIPAISGRLMSKE
jgi:hypothetical protein